MKSLPTSKKAILELIETGIKLPMATQNYPSRGQSAVQELYQTKLGKLFLKRVSKRNHTECQVKIENGTIAEREFWASSLAKDIGLDVPSIFLIDEFTTVQPWLDYPDGHIYSSHEGRMEFNIENIFDCGIFDWLTGQVDRHDANYLYNLTEQKIILVDSGHSFLKYDGSLPDYLKLFEMTGKLELKQLLQSKIKDRIIKLSDDHIHKLVPLKDIEEKEAFFRRKNKLNDIASLEDLISLYRR
ncbi:MAG: hypothetical protein ABIE74_03165 [Pseudomonadota bacterium]